MNTQFTVPMQEPYHLTRVIQRFAGAAQEMFNLGKFGVDCTYAFQVTEKWDGQVSDLRDYFP